MTRDEAIASAGEAYGAILADPERREQLRAHRAQLALRGGARAPSVAVTPRAAAEGSPKTHK